MATKYIVEEVRATGWSMRLRDTRTGETYEVPLAPGARFTQPLEPRNKEEHPAAEVPAKTDSAASPPEKPKKPKAHPRKTTPRKAKEAHEAAANPLQTREGRYQRVDESTLTADDRVALEKQQAMFRRAAGIREGKKGGLGWQETTDNGRSGLRARFHKGAFKILHAGGDTYALFYEWDGGKYERIACGTAQDLMDIATKRAQQELPKPPPTLLDLELARFVCGTAEQRKAAEERLRPVFRDVHIEPDLDADPTLPRRDHTEPAAPEPVRPRRGRRASPLYAPKPVPTPTPAPPDVAPPAADITIDPNLDNTLASSLKQALREMEEE